MFWAEFLEKKLFLTSAAFLIFSRESLCIGWQLCIARNHAKIMHLWKNKQQIGPCEKIKNKTTRQKRKGMLSICDNTDRLRNKSVHRRPMYPVDTVPCFYHRFRWYSTLENKPLAETFPKFPSVLCVIDRSDRNPPITVTNVTWPSLHHASGLWLVDFDPTCR